MKEHEFDVGYWLLDDQLVDSDGRRCGRVDDVEFEGEPGEEAVMVALRTGPGASRRRLPRRLRRLTSRLLSDEEERIPWDQVAEIDVVVELKRPGGELGLGKGDDEAGRVIAKIPGAR